jgi:hypothetical protein
MNNRSTRNFDETVSRIQVCSESLDQFIGGADLSPAQVASLVGNSANPVTMPGPTFASQTLLAVQNILVEGALMGNRIAINALVNPISINANTGQVTFNIPNNPFTVNLPPP